MYNVIDTGIPRSLASFLKTFAFFYWKKFNVGGEKISLYRYENDVIRTLGDACVHFALNRMSIFCRQLPRVPFTANSVQRQLDAETRRFFTETRNIVSIIRGKPSKSRRSSISTPKTSSRRIRR